MPPDVVFRCCALVAAEERVLAEAYLTPELIDSFKAAFRGVEPLAYVRREELEQIGCLEDFARPADNAMSEQHGTLGLDNERADN